MGEQSIHRDALVIGAGLGGLSAAVQLRAAGIETGVLEANERCGGRIYSVAHSTGAELGIDLGPTWFWPHQTHMRELVQTLELGVFGQFDRGAALYQLAPDTVQRVDGPMPPSFRIYGGTAKLTDALRDRLPEGDVRTGHTVTHVAHDAIAGVWHIRASTATGTRSFSATHLLVAVPPRIWLRIAGVDGLLSPGLAAELAATPTWMASHAKFVATYATPFWRTADLAGDAFSRVGPMAEIHDASAEDDGHAALFGFLGLPAPGRREMGAEALRAQCLAQLVQIFGTDAANPLQASLKDWAADPLIATDADLQGVPVHPSINLAPYRAEMESLNLSFPVSEAASTEGGYLEGALVAARAAVEKVQQARVGS
jgi:monoamine oxidase